MSDLKNSKPTKTVSTRVDEEAFKRIEFAAKYFETTRGDISRQLLTKAILTVFNKDKKLRESYERKTKEAKL